MISWNTSQYNWHSYLKFTLVILDPNWLIEVMATLFTTKHHWIKNGLLVHTDLPQIWKDYNPEIYDSLLFLMKKNLIF